MRRVDYYVKSLALSKGAGNGKLVGSNLLDQELTNTALVRLVTKRTNLIRLFLPTWCKWYHTPLVRERPGFDSRCRL